VVCLFFWSGSRGRRGGGVVVVLINFLLDKKFIVVYKIKYTYVYNTYTAKRNIDVCPKEQTKTKRYILKNRNLKVT